MTQEEKKMKMATQDLCSFLDRERPTLWKMYESKVDESFSVLGSSLNVPDNIECKVKENVT